MLELGKHLEIRISPLALSCNNCTNKDRHRDIDVSVTTFTGMSVHIELCVDSVIYVADVHFFPDVDTGDTCKIFKFEKSQTHMEFKTLFHFKFKKESPTQKSFVSYD